MALNTTCQVQPLKLYCTSLPYQNNRKNAKDAFIEKIKSYAN
jgi:hypothetical protein